ncbi:MAG: portal protein [Candidatus Thorarchaeota archaeon]
MTTTAEQIIKLADLEIGKALNFRNLYQEVADLMYPCENQITEKTTPGEDKSQDVIDPTGIIALNRATSGFISAWIPKDRQFFGIHIKDRMIAELPVVKRWVALAVQIAHEELFASNYMQQLQQTVKSTIGFGTGCSFSEWDRRKSRLNFKDWHISTYTIKQDITGSVDTIILSYELTARQLVDEFGDKAGPKVLEKCRTVEHESDRSKVIHIVRPRLERNVKFIDSLNMPFESLYVNREEKLVMDEGGFEEFPFAVPRWEKSSVEKYGRGRGTLMLSAVKLLQRMMYCYLECGERWNNPSRWQIDDRIEGDLNNSPGALNHFTEPQAAGALDSQLNGNFPITLEALQAQQTFIRNEGFFEDIFMHFRNLKGDRRNELELMLKNEEGLDQLVAPVINVESELFTPQITRAVLLLIRNGRIPMPPPELHGQEFDIEYMGKLAMASKQYQANGFIKFSQFMKDVDPIFPRAKYYVSEERAIPDIAIAMGLKAEHLATEDEISAKIQREEEDKRLARELAVTEAQSQSYKNQTKAPEHGSPMETANA